MRKIYWLFLAFVLMVPIFLTSTSHAATVNDARWVTRNDAPVPFVRMVMDVSSPVKASASISKSGLSTTVSLKNAKLGNVKQAITMDKTIASSARLRQNGNNVDVTINTPKAVGVSDVKVFSLKKDIVNNKPYRIVVDIQKKGVAPKSTYYGKKASPGPVPVALPKTKKAQKIVGSTSYTTSGGLRGKLITLDAGHGGSDPGAIGPNGSQEKNVTLPIAKYLKADLEAMGAKVNMTRTTDVDVYAPNASGVDELQARSDVANNSGADAFVSIHINSFDNPSVGGIATYYYAKTSHDANLAQAVQNQIAGQYGFNGDRGIQPGNLYVLRNTNMPAILVELGFISNPTEEGLLNTDSTRQDFARKIAQGIANYFR